MTAAAEAVENVALDIAALGEALAAVVEVRAADALHSRASADAWSLAEIVGHASEFPLTFATKALELSRTPGLLFGRSLDDPGRVSAVARLQGRSSAEAAAFIRQATREAAAVVRQIDPTAWGTMGFRADGSEVAVGTILESLVRDHLKVHLKQARTATPANA